MRQKILREFRSQIHEQFSLSESDFSVSAHALPCCICRVWRSQHNAELCCDKLPRNALCVNEGFSFARWN